MRVRCIGLRYRDSSTGQTFTPDAIHFAYLRSWLRRAYPVPDVIWSQIVVDADFEAPFRSAAPVLADAQLAAIRNFEMSTSGHFSPWRTPLLLLRSRKIGASG